MKSRRKQANANCSPEGQEDEEEEDDEEERFYADGNFKTTNENGLLINKNKNNNNSNEDEGYR